MVGIFRSQSCIEPSRKDGALSLEELRHVTEISNLEKDFHRHIFTLRQQEEQSFQLATTNAARTTNSSVSHALPMTHISPSCQLGTIKDEQIKNEQIKYEQINDEIFSWQVALQDVLVEKRRLVELLFRYRRVVRELRTMVGEGSYYRAVQESIDQRGRSRTEKETLLAKSLDITVETDDGIGMPSSSGLALGGTIDEGKRKFSNSSSILYAGVEPPKNGTIPRPLEKATSIPNIHLIRAMNGTWLYKYPRRQYQKLIVQPTLPVTQLSYRFFWLNPVRSLLCWAENESRDRELRQVRLTDFYTEERTLPLDPNHMDTDDAESGRRVAGLSTIIIVITEEKKPLTLVPTSDEDLELWIGALQFVVQATRIPSFPFNFRITMTP